MCNLFILALDCTILFFNLFTLFSDSLVCINKIAGKQIPSFCLPFSLKISFLWRLTC